MNAIQPTTIEEQVRSAIQEVPRQFESHVSDRLWTKAILKPLANLGKARGFEVCSTCSDGEHDCGWLYDLVWYQEDTNDLLKSVPLVLECEWHRNYDRIKYDFEKLLIAQASYKIMVFQAKGEQQSEYFLRMKAGILSFERTNKEERYLLACFNEDKWEFEFDSYGSASDS